MYAGGLLATLLILGMFLLVISLAMIISEPRDAQAPQARQEPGDITRRLRSQAMRGRRHTEGQR
jgi:hypothetical protein